MKKIFTKNLLVFIIYTFATLGYFKVVMYQLETELLAQYFYVKAVAMIVFFVCSIRFSDAAYMLKVNANSSYVNIKGLFVVLYGAIILFLAVLGMVLYFLGAESSLIFVLAIIIYVMNDAMEGFIGTCRLFYQYRIILYFRILLILKVPAFFFLPVSKTLLINILLFESCFAIFLFFTMALFNIKYVRPVLLSEIKYISSNLHLIFSIWFQGVGKLAYDALPRVMLVKLVSDTVYVEYNIASRILSLFGNAMQPILQFFIAESVKYKNNYFEFFKKYLVIVIPVSLSIVLIVHLNFEIIVTLIARSEYAVLSVQQIILLSFSLFVIYLILVPIKQFLMLGGEFKLLSIGYFISSSIIAITVYFLLPHIGVYGAVLAQGIGLSLPLIIAISIYFCNNRKV